MTRNGVLCSINLEEKEAAATGDCWGFFTQRGSKQVFCLAADSCLDWREIMVLKRVESALMEVSYGVADIYVSFVPLLISVQYIFQLFKTLHNCKTCLPEADHGGSSHRGQLCSALKKYQH